MIPHLKFYAKKLAFWRVDLSQYLGHILVETVTSYLLLPTLQTPVGLDSESSYGFDFGYKTLQCS